MAKGGEKSRHLGHIISRNITEQPADIKEKLIYSILAAFACI